MLKLNLKWSLLVAVSCSAIACVMSGFSEQDPIKSEKLTFNMEIIETGINVPWGMEFLPNGDILVTEKSGQIKVIRNGKVQEQEITGVPKVYARGQGGLFDLQLHPKYAENGWIYISYSAPNPDGNGGMTHIMRAKLKGNALTDQEVLFKGAPYTTSGVHFGGRMEFGKDGYLYFSIGERGEKEKAQSLETYNGKVYRIKDDGTIPTDNPFYNTPGAIKAIYSYGHRNPQGLRLHPQTGELWETEHGPMGGDELNIVRKGKNYGWPKVTFGIDYNGAIISKDTTLPGIEAPIFYWKPSIATSNLVFVTGNKYPSWKGNVLVCGMVLQRLERLELNGDQVTHREILLDKIGRVRNVEQGPDGFIYVSVEGGKIIKIVPAA